MLETFRAILAYMNDAVVPVSLQGLSKRYDNAPSLALDNVSLKVAQGEVYGFLGANGAGKTTTIRTLLGFLSPSSGSASINGYDIVHQSVQSRKSVGYLAGDVALYGKLTGKQLLDYLSGLGQTVDMTYRAQLADMFEAQLDKPISELSRGNRQKVGIIQAFMHRPDVLIMDEPTTGLDPLMQEAFFQLIRDTKARGAAVFMSSHNFSEVQRTCDRAGIIRSGHLVKEQDIIDLNHSHQQRFTITFADEPPVTNLAALRKVTVTGHEGHDVTLVVEGDLSPLLQLLAKHKVARLTSRSVDLEQEFLQFYGEDEAS